jgi:catechol 2,3-dioxygenase-like lactoylglutathione lyase family enzyme
LDLVVRFGLCGTLGRQVDTVTIEKLVEDFENRKLTRRDLVAALTVLAAGTTPAPAAAQITQSAKGESLNHVSIAVTDVERSADFYSKLLGLKVVSRPGNGGINLGLGTSFLGFYKLANPGTVHHFCIGVDDYDADKIAARLRAMGLKPSVDRNPANRTTGGDQLYFTDPDGTRVQLGANGYQG